MRRHMASRQCLRTASLEKIAVARGSEGGWFSSSRVFSILVIFLSDTMLLHLKRLWKSFYCLPHSQTEDDSFDFPPAIFHASEVSCLRQAMELCSYQSDDSHYSISQKKGNSPWEGGKTLLNQHQNGKINGMTQRNHSSLHQCDYCRATGMILI